jgi:hypothetical protein
MGKANFKQVTTAVGFIGATIFLLYLKYELNIESIHLRKGILAILLVPFLAICLFLSSLMCWAWDHFLVRNSIRHKNPKKDISQNVDSKSRSPTF